jgi:peptidoglycan/xylan/chitin deacetylase (PgdA/CDA1 family)
MVVGRSPWDSLEDELIEALDERKASSSHERNQDPSKGVSALEPTRKEYKTEKPLQKLFLTFDDGPSLSVGRILDLLAESRQKATFFVIGRNLERPKLRDLAIRALREGHDIGNHSYTHPNFSSVSAQRAETEIFKTHEIINGLVRETEVDYARQNLFFRFPYGNSGSIYNYAACRKILAGLGYRVAWWDLDTWDWRMELRWLKRNSTKVLASLKKAKPRDVVLLHDRVKTSEHLPEILDALRTQKLVSIPLSDYDKAIERKADGDALIDRLELMSPHRIGYAKSATVSLGDLRSYRKNFLVGSIGKVPKGSSNYRGHFRSSLPHR